MVNSLISIGSESKVSFEFTSDSSCPSVTCRCCIRSWQYADMTNLCTRRQHRLAASRASQSLWFCYSCEKIQGLVCFKGARNTYMTWHNSTNGSYLSVSSSIQPIMPKVLNIRCNVQWVKGNAHSPNIWGTPDVFLTTIKSLGCFRFSSSTHEKVSSAV